MSLLDDATIPNPLQPEEYIPYQEVNFNDPRFSYFNVDTRDFHCLPVYGVEDHKKIQELDLHKVGKKPTQYLHTGDEVKAMLDRLFKGSGGESDHRVIGLSGIAKFRTQNWQLKYIRLYRTSLGLLVCTTEDFIMSKAALSEPIMMYGKVITEENSIPVDSEKHITKQEPKPEEPLILPPD